MLSTLKRDASLCDDRGTACRPHRHVGHVVARVRDLPSMASSSPFERGQRCGPDPHLALHAVDREREDVGRPSRVEREHRSRRMQRRPWRGACAEQQRVLVRVAAELVQVDALVLILLGDRCAVGQLLQAAVDQAAVGQPRGRCANWRDRCTSPVSLPVATSMTCSTLCSEPPTRNAVRDVTCCRATARSSRWRNARRRAISPRRDRPAGAPCRACPDARRAWGCFRSAGAFRNR